MNVCVFGLQIFVEFNSVIVKKIMTVCVFDLQIFVEFTLVIDCQKDHECMRVWFADLCGDHLGD